MKWVVQYDVEHSYNYFIGLMVEPSELDSPERTRKLKQTRREIERVAESEYDEINAGKTEKDKEDEKRFKQELSSLNDAVPCFVLDTNDKSEYWRYLYEYNKLERKFDGLLYFVERFYRDYTIKELLVDADLKDITSKTRDRLLIMANKIAGFLDEHTDKIKGEVPDYLERISKTVLRMPQARAFRTGKRRIIINGVMHEKDENEEADLN